MSQQELYPFDFRNAGTADEVVRMLREWMRKTSDAFCDSWEAVSNSEANFHCHSVLTRTFEEGVAAVPLDSVGFGMMVGAEPLRSLACMSTQDLVSLIGAIVGTSFEYQNRKLTTIEVSLCEMVFETLASALGAAWFGEEPLEIRVAEVEELPHFARLIPVKELVLSSQIELQVADVTVKMVWLVPRKGIESLLEATTGTLLKTCENTPEAVVRHMDLELVGLLGTTEMTMGELTDLNVGDLMLLNQKIDQPIPVMIDKQPIFDGWPGRVGKSQGIEISRVL